jgi:anti-sigma B factor antagonist
MVITVETSAGPGQTIVCEQLLVAGHFSGGRRSGITMSVASNANDESIDHWLAWDGDDDGAPLAPLSLDLHIDYRQRRIMAFGELDAVSSGALVDAIAMLVASNPGDSALDIAYLTFIDAGGLGAIIDANTQLAAVAAELVVVGASSRVRRMFEVAGMGPLLETD